MHNASPFKNVHFCVKGYRLTFDDTSHAHIILHLVQKKSTKPKKKLQPIRSEVYETSRKKINRRAPNYIRETRSVINNFEQTIRQSGSGGEEGAFDRMTSWNQKEDDSKRRGRCSKTETSQLGSISQPRSRPGRFSPAPA